MSEILKRAEEFAIEMHMGQFDRGGVPYIEHPKAVASKVDGEIEKAVAWLHDVVEDTSATIQEVRILFGDEVADAVELLTHKKGVPYLEYVRGIKGNEIARKVKMADLQHNMDISRLPVVNDDDWNRVAKYRKAYDILSDTQR